LISLVACRFARRSRALRPGPRCHDQLVTSRPGISPPRVDKYRAGVDDDAAAAPRGLTLGCIIEP